MPAERNWRSELPKSPESPRAVVVSALRGQISERIETTSYKPGEEGTRVKVNIVQEGAGLLDLPDIQDNKKWADLFDHSLLAARCSTHIAEKLNQSGYSIKSQTLLDATLVSHAGVRQWEEARYYPEIVPQAKEKAAKSPEALGLEIIHGKVPQDAYDLVEGLSLDGNDTLEHKIGSYVLHKKLDFYQPLFTTMGNFMYNNFYDEDDDPLDTRQRVLLDTRSIIERRKGIALGNTNVTPVTLDEADAMFAQSGAKETSGHWSRRDLIKLIFQDAEVDALLLKNGINPVTIHGKKVPMPAWEDDLRQQYVEGAEPDILAELFALEHQARKGSKDAADRIKEKYSDFDWWGKYSVKMFEEWRGQKLDTSSFAPTYPIFPNNTPPRYNKPAKPTKTISPDEKYL